MATEFHAYLKANKLPSPDTLVRALCSRGWTFNITGEEALDQRSGDLGLSVDGTEHAVSVSSVAAGTPAWKALTDSAGDREDGEEFTKVLTVDDIISGAFAMQKQVEDATKRSWQA